MKTMYSLMLDDALIKLVDGASFQSGVSRSQYINELLAEHFGLDTPTKRLQSIFDEIFSYLRQTVGLKVERRQQSSVDFLGSLEYKYSPRVTYSVELDGMERRGKLRVTLRTTNSALLDITDRFFNDFIETEKSMGKTARYDVDSGRFVRSLDFSAYSADKLPVAITEYVKAFDKLLNLYVANYGETTKKDFEKYYLSLFGDTEI